MKAANELGVYLTYMKSKFQPTMEPTKTLGTYDDTGNPRHREGYICRLNSTWLMMWITKVTLILSGMSKIIAP